MASHLLIVESPSKAKTLKKYLGKDFEILASYGHVRDLVPKTGAVDPDDNFRMKYELIDRNAKHVDAIAKAVKDVDIVMLATDPDRARAGDRALQEPGILDDALRQREGPHRLLGAAHAFQGREARPVRHRQRRARGRGAHLPRAQRPRHRARPRGREEAQAPLPGGA